MQKARHRHGDAQLVLKPRFCDIEVFDSHHQDCLAKLPGNHDFCTALRAVLEAASQYRDDEPAALDELLKVRHVALIHLEHLATRQQVVLPQEPGIASTP